MPTPSDHQLMQIAPADATNPAAHSFGDEVRRTSSLAYIAGLDGLRAFAILGVAAFHFTSYFQTPLRALGPWWDGFARITSTGWIGVDLFFALSGFLITRLLIQNDIHNASAYRQYIVRRARRLLPAYVACVAALSLLLLIAYPQSKVLHNSYLLWTFTTDIQTLLGTDRTALGDQYVSLVHFWTLALEWQFYLLFPLAVAMIRSLTRTTGALVVLAIACRLVLHIVGASDNAIYSFFFCRIDSLAFGCFFASPAAVRLLPYRRLLALAAAGVLGMTIALLAASDQPFKQLAWLQMAGYSIVGLTSSVIVWFVAHARREGLVVRLLEMEWLSVIGRSSYSIYIWHIVFYPSIVLMARQWFDDPRAACTAAIVAGSIVTALLSMVSYRWIEWSLVRRKRGSER